MIKALKKNRNSGFQNLILVYRMLAVIMPAWHGMWSQCSMFTSRGHHSHRSRDTLPPAENELELKVAGLLNITAVT